MSSLPSPPQTPKALSHSCQDNAPPWSPEEFRLPFGETLVRLSSSSVNYCQAIKSPDNFASIFSFFRDRHERFFKETRASFMFGFRCVQARSPCPTRPENAKGKCQAGHSGQRSKRPRRPSCFRPALSG